MSVTRAEDQLELLKNKNKDLSCILFNHAGFEWQLILNGRIFESSTFKEKWNTVATNNKDGATNPTEFKKMIIAILKAGIENNIESINKLIKEAGCGEEIEYDEVMDLLKMPYDEFTKL